MYNTKKEIYKYSETNGSRGDINISSYVHVADCFYDYDFVSTFSASVTF